MRAILDYILWRLIVYGHLIVKWPDGKITDYSGKPGPKVQIHITGKSWVRRLSFNPTLAFGEAYMEGGLVPIDCSIYDVLEFLMINRASKESHQEFFKIQEFIGDFTRRFGQYNPIGRSRRNVAHHYDLDRRLYDLFLDSDQQYSCAYFLTGYESLEEAQIAKKKHIATKLWLNRPNLKVLDIGSGWGGLAITLAREYDANVTGITLSSEQLAVSQDRIKAEGLEDRVHFKLEDYRNITGQFDRIVSVGMFEHVGVNHYRTFFDVVNRCLTSDGVALLHSIGRNYPPGHTNAWLAKYIFPGGYCPSLSEVIPAIEKSGLLTTDIEILRLHYAETLRHWHQRFDENREDILTLYGERFYRMFEFYLSSSELTFRHENMMVFQIQMAKDQNVVPLTREYIDK